MWKTCTLLLPIFKFNIKTCLFQHKEFEEIEGRLRRREPLIVGSTAAQRLSRRPPVEVVSDPLNDMENDPYEEGNDVQKHPRGHQVSSFYDCMMSYCLLFIFSIAYSPRFLTMLPSEHAMLA